VPYPNLSNPKHTQFFQYLTWGVWEQDAVECVQTWVWGGGGRLLRTAQWGASLVSRSVGWSAGRSVSQSVSQFVSGCHSITIHPCPVPRSRTRGAILPLPNTSSWRGIYLSIETKRRRTQSWPHPHQVLRSKNVWSYTSNPQYAFTA